MLKACDREDKNTVQWSEPIGVMNCSRSLVDHRLCRLFAEWPDY